jgi:hypothetical protein
MAGTTENNEMPQIPRDRAIHSGSEQYHNPGNIFQGNSGKWPGQVGVGTVINRGFKAFATPADGAAAHAYLIERYVFQRGYKNFGQIVRTYAPASDGNNVGEYTHIVSTYTDRIARSLGYNGPQIDGNTNLRTLLDDPRYRDVVLAATVAAMEKMEIDPEQRKRMHIEAADVLAAIRSKYANKGGEAHTAFKQYSQAIGSNPRIVSSTGGLADGDGESQRDRDIDAVGNDALKDFFKGLVGIAGALLAALFGAFQIPPSGQQASRDNSSPATGAGARLAASGVTLTPGSGISTNVGSVIASPQASGPARG